MDLRARRGAPVPRRRLVLVLLGEAALFTDWRSHILEPTLSHLLGASRSGSLLILFLGLPCSDALALVQRSIRAILQAISAQAAAEARRLRRLYLGQP